nr:hypothetical protein [Tanacetum cinerariifolium]
MNIDDDVEFASNTIIGEKIDKIERQIGKNKLRLLDNDENPLVLTGIVESDSEVKVVYDDTANLMIPTSGNDRSDKGYGTDSLLEQWRDSYADNDDYDPYDDDMYENHDLSEHLQSICDDHDITKDASSHSQIPKINSVIKLISIHFQQASVNNQKYISKNFEQILNLLSNATKINNPPQRSTNRHYPFNDMKAQDSRTKLQDLLMISGRVEPAVSWRDSTTRTVFAVMAGPIPFYLFSVCETYSYFGGAAPRERCLQPWRAGYLFIHFRTRKSERNYFLRLIRSHIDARPDSVSLTFISLSHSHSHAKHDCESVREIRSGSKEPSMKSSDTFLWVPYLGGGNTIIQASAAMVGSDTLFSIIPSIVVECDLIVVCELLLGLQPWQGNLDVSRIPSFAIMLVGAAVLSEGCELAAMASLFSE